MMDMLVKKLQPNPEYIFVVIDQVNTDKWEAESFENRFISRCQTVGTQFVARSANVRVQKLGLTERATHQPGPGRKRGQK